MIISRSIIIINLIAVTCLWAIREYHVSTRAIVRGNAGPDVIVGVIPSINRWGNDSDETAFSIGTTSCNIGNARLDWIQNTPIHPVISQNMYRIKNGRIEMLGMSWLKHGFSVAAGSDCNSCTEPSSVFLGVGCSDPYGASLNGQHGLLGPRSQINATTGVFPMPHGTLPTTGTLDGRIRVFTADLVPAQNVGARYFVESQYIHPQDAASGNGLNNASYREAFVEAEGTTGSAWDIETGAPLTVREKPAISAWKAVHPDVELFNVDVPGDGRIIVGMRTTPNAGGGYHTEFAVQNVNSHQSVKSLGVTYGSNTISNPGFRDVDYQFEPYSGTNWAPITVGNKIEWSTQTFAQNPNANALRWNTLYSFWCDSALPPRSLSLGMFRPGTVSEMNVDLVSAVVPVSFSLSRAAATGGQFLNVFLSDNQYFRLSPIVVKQTPGIDFNIEANLATSTPTDFAFRLEAAMSGLPVGEVVQMIEMFNHVTGNYEVIDTRAAELTDNRVSVTPTGDWSRFIQTGTRLVKARIAWRYVVPNGRNPYSWSIDIDEAVWLFAD